MLLACLALFVAPGIAYPGSVQVGWSWDVLWREGFWKQVSGFTLLGLSVVAAVLSLRKRWRRFSFGGFDGWRALHVALGIAVVAGLLVHTGGRLGSQLNALLATGYTGLLAAGALAAVVIGREHRLQPAHARRLRSAFLWTHILLFWPIPVLLGFHVFKTYYF
jgi:nitrite reductase (NADH) large subunit